MGGVSLAEFWMVSGIQYRETTSENRLETEQYLQMHHSGMSWGPGLDLNGLSMWIWWEDCAGF